MELARRILVLLRQMSKIIAAATDVQHPVDRVSISRSPQVSPEEPAAGAAAAAAAVGLVVLEVEVVITRAGLGGSSRLHFSREARSSI